jgi:hypothetical protein
MSRCHRFSTDASERKSLVSNLKFKITDFFFPDAAGSQLGNRQLAIATRQCVHPYRAPGRNCDHRNPGGDDKGVTQIVAKPAFNENDKVEL